MPKKTLYHYSTQDYQPERIISQEADHYQRLTGTQQTAEDELRAHSPEAAQTRATCVYAWESRDMAEFGWCQKKGFHLYELEVDENDIRHIGDIDIFSAIERALAKKEPTEALRRDYWDGKRTGKRIEVLASEAKVKRRVKDSSERQTPMQKAILKHRQEI
jgi:hypothetical protein